MSQYPNLIAAKDNNHLKGVNYIAVHGLRESCKITEQSKITPLRKKKEKKRKRKKEAEQINE
jgi:hypothetical protein